MSKTDQLNCLFNCWIKKHYKKCKSKFARDGIINEAEYNRKKPKILFIAKEPNDPDQQGAGFEEWFASLGEKNWLFERKICQWAFGIQNDFPDFGIMKKQMSCKSKRVKICQSIALMNLKKIGGGDVANVDEIRETASEQRDFIAAQINIINPDIIIGGIGLDLYLWEVIFPRIKFHVSEYDTRVAKYKSKAVRSKSYKIIDYYHPSFRRYSDADLYDHLGKVFHSDTFRDL